MRGGLANPSWSDGRWSGRRFLTRDGDCGGCNAQKNGGKKRRMQNFQRSQREELGEARDSGMGDPLNTANFRRLCLQDDIPKDALFPGIQMTSPSILALSLSGSAWAAKTLCQHGFWKGVGFQVVFIQVQPTQTACLYTND